MAAALRNTILFTSAYISSTTSYKNEKSITHISVWCLKKLNQLSTKPCWPTSLALIPYIYYTSLIQVFIITQFQLSSPPPASYRSSNVTMGCSVKLFCFIAFGASWGEVLLHIIALRNAVSFIFACISSRASLLALIYSAKANW